MFLRSTKMSTKYPEDLLVQVTLNALEDDTPAALLAQFMVEYNIPVRAVAQSMGISVPMVYQYLKVKEGGHRATEAIAPRLEKMVEHMKVLAAEGKLAVEKAAHRSARAWAALLEIEAPSQ